MRIIVNGEERETTEHATISALIEQLSLAPERLAVEHNRQVVRRLDWPRIYLNEGDRIEIIHFVGGGGGQTKVGRRRVEAKADGCLCLAAF